MASAAHERGAEQGCKARTRATTELQDGMDQMHGLRIKSQQSEQSTAAARAGVSGCMKRA